MQESLPTRFIAVDAPISCHHNYVKSGKHIVVDEVPAAYEDVDSVIAAQSGLVGAIAQVRQAIFIMG